MGFRILTALSRQIVKPVLKQSSLTTKLSTKQLLLNFKRNLYATSKIHFPQTCHRKSLPNVEEVKIDVPWGHIAGKWWGPKHIRPIICLHGWQDNAGSFDTLIPHLPPHLSYLSLDLPGHGLSSWIPDGMFYHSGDFLYMILTIMKKYDWEQVSLMAHSLGSILSFSFSSLFPEKVDLVIGIDALKPMVRPITMIPQLIRFLVSSYVIADERNRDKSEPPSYTYEEMVEKLYVGTFQSVDRETCKYLLARNIKPSKVDPGKFYFSRDNRLKGYYYGFVSQELNLVLAKQIVAPYLYIKATNSTYFEDKKYFDECIEVLQQSPVFEFHTVEGSHHVHLNEPTKVSGIITDFINTYRPIQRTS